MPIVVGTTVEIDQLLVGELLDVDARQPGQRQLGHGEPVERSIGSCSGSPSLRRNWLKSKSAVTWSVASSSSRIAASSLILRSRIAGRLRGRFAAEDLLRHLGPAIEQDLAALLVDQLQSPVGRRVVRQPPVRQLSKCCTAGTCAGDLFLGPSAQRVAARFRPAASLASSSSVR